MAEWVVRVEKQVPTAVEWMVGVKRQIDKSCGMEINMINIFEVAETNEMIEKENLDVRTITLGISLLDCIDADLKLVNEKIYHKIYDAAKDLVATGEYISGEYGIPIVNKRISVTPISLIDCKYA